MPRQRLRNTRAQGIRSPRARRSRLWIAVVVAVLFEAGLSVAYLAANTVEPTNADDQSSPFTIGGCTSKTWWLKGPGTAVPDTMDGSSPTGPDVQKVVHKDALTVRLQTDQTKFHSWQTSVASGSGVQLCGSTSLVLWLRAKGNNKQIKIAAQLYDCPDGAPAGSLTCTTIGPSSYVAGTWADYQQRTINFGTINYTVPPGRRLRVKIANEDTAPSNAQDDARVNWNSALYPSRLVMTAA